MKFWVEYLHLKKLIILNFQTHLGNKVNFEFIYKIIDKQEWHNAKKNKEYLGSQKDKEDGFIHFSEQEQIKNTLDKYFKGVSNLLLLKVKTINLEHLLWEQASDGNMFPHLYSSLNISEVVEELEIVLDNNNHILPTNL